MKEKFDFSGWATKNDILCSDGRTIKHNAFADDDGKTVPLVWMHNHDDPDYVLGHAVLENRNDGVYAYCKFNDSPEADSAKIRVRNGDVNSLSIYANKLKQDSHRNVMHGSIKEVSLVLAGANSGAVIENVMLVHSDGYEMLNDEAEIMFNEPITLVDGMEHSDEEKKEDKMSEEQVKKTTEADKKEKTIGEIYEEMTDEQKKAVEAMLTFQANQLTKQEPEKEEKESMKHNVFESDTDTKNVLSHDDLNEIMKESRRLGSLKEGVEEFTLSHADYGIDNVDYLFPDARTLTNTPDFIKRQTDWVADFMGKTKKTPFSRIKSVFADITADEARAKGYTKGNKKLDEVITLLKRSTTPTTVYKKQRMDRDDVLDITDFDVIAWLKMEMKLMLDEEIARAALIGDGRSTASDDKIKEDCIRPIAKDDDLYAVKVPLGETITDYTEVIKDILRARKQYKGSGNPTLYTTEDVLTEMLLIEDKMGRPMYDTIEKLATKLRVSKIETVEAMESDTEVLGIIVNPIDYTFGADKGGETNFFDDFDIRFNQQLYLYEGRCSGALTKPYSALVLQKKAKAAGE